MGFGSLTVEFWFGLNALHCLTSQGEWELRIDLKLTDGTLVYLSYKQFAVGPASETVSFNNIRIYWIYK